MHLFETEVKAFLSTPIADWPKKFVELTTSAAFREDSNENGYKTSVEDYLR